jgi:hypothetical protein
MIEIETLNGVVTSTSDALAQAMAELIAAEHRADEGDLLEAVGIDLTDVPSPRGATSSAA